MSEAGYTLSETLAAMAVISLAIGGLSQGLQVLGPLQRSTSATVFQTQAAQQVQDRIERLLAVNAPFASADPAHFSGDANGFQFECAAPQICKVEVTVDQEPAKLRVFDGRTALEVPLPASGAAHFLYRGSRAVQGLWPDAAGNQTLKSVALVQSTKGGDVAVLEAKVWSEQSLHCAFDPISQDCR